MRRAPARLLSSAALLAESSNVIESRLFSEGENLIDTKSRVK